MQCVEWKKLREGQAEYEQTRNRARLRRAWRAASAEGEQTRNRARLRRAWGWRQDKGKVEREGISVESGRNDEVQQREQKAEKNQMQEGET